MAHEQTTASVPLFLSLSSHWRHDPRARLLWQGSDRIISGSCSVWTPQQSSRGERKGRALRRPLSSSVFFLFLPFASCARYIHSTCTHTHTYAHTRTHTPSPLLFLLDSVCDKPGSFLFSLLLLPLSFSRLLFAFPQPCPGRCCAVCSCCLRSPPQSARCGCQSSSRTTWCWRPARRSTSGPLSLAGPIPEKRCGMRRRPRERGRG